MKYNLVKYPQIILLINYENLILRFFWTTSSDIEKISFFNKLIFRFFNFFFAKIEI